MVSSMEDTPDAKCPWRRTVGGSDGRTVGRSDGRTVRRGVRNVHGDERHPGQDDAGAARAELVRPMTESIDPMTAGIGSQEEVAGPITEVVGSVTIALRWATAAIPGLAMMIRGRTTVAWLRAMGASATTIALLSAAMACTAWTKVVRGMSAGVSPLTIVVTCGTMVVRRGRKILPVVTVNRVGGCSGVRWLPGDSTSRP